MVNDLILMDLAMLALNLKIRLTLLVMIDCDSIRDVIRTRKLSLILSSISHIITKCSII